MQKKTKLLKNDHNNHLSDQIEQLKKGQKHSSKRQASVMTSKSKENTNLDHVTSEYIRGYN